MSQPPLGGGGGGQRSGTAQPFYIPTLMSSMQQQQPQPQQVVITSGNGGAPISSSSSSFYMSTLMPSLQQQQQQQAVAITSSGNGVTAVITSSTFIQPGVPPTIAPTVSVIQHPPPVATANLYLCTTSKNATDAPVEGDAADAKKASIEMLEESYKQLNARKIKDSLSSFLPDIPGEFDSMESPETKLQHLLEQRVIGSKEFHPLSGHALLGFRLLPGPLPEQYRIDPPLQETRSHHHKKKHKHRSIEKVGDEGSDLNPPSTKVKMPNDAYVFLKSESSLLSAPPPSIHVTERAVAPPKVVPSGAHVYSPALTATTVVGSSLMVGQDPLNPFPGGKKKKEKKRSKEKKKEKKEKKKKKDKHHGQDPPVGPPGNPQSTPHQHTHTHGGMA